MALDKTTHASISINKTSKTFETKSLNDEAWSEKAWEISVQLQPHDFFKQSVFKLAQYQKQNL